nr:DUF4058 family protein [Armatimonadota bacterium]
HNAWATYLSSQLNEWLPEGYFAEANVQFGIELDVAAYEEATASPGLDGVSATGTPSMRTGNVEWAPAEPQYTLPITMSSESVEVNIYDSEGGPTLAGAIELVSPANKDRPASRDAFVAKCAAYVQGGIGLVIVDVVTERRANLHNELLQRLTPTAMSGSQSSDLYASAYRTVQRDGTSSLDIWYEELLVGCPLPSLPLWLRGDLCVRVDLDASYERTCREQRLDMSFVPTGR